MCCVVTQAALALIAAINKKSRISQYVFDMGAFPSQRNTANIFGKQDTCTACLMFDMNDDIKKSSSRGLTSRSYPFKSFMPAAPSKGDAGSESKRSNACGKLLKCTSISSTMIPLVRWTVM